MKVLIFDSTTIDKAPYIENYTKIFDEVGVKYDVCTWDKYSGNGTVSKKSGLITIHKQWHLGKRKLIDFISVSRILKRIIKSEGYTNLIIVNSIWAILLYDVLIKFRGKYILDIRDYKCENVFGMKSILKMIIEDSFFTTISSGGFREFLPESNKIIENHNISNWNYEEQNSTLCSEKDTINIVYMGYIRYNVENLLFLNGIKDCCNLFTTYLGIYDIFFNVNKSINLKNKNVSWGGKFKNEEKPILYKNYDMILSAYGSNHISTKTLLPNRLYDGILFKKPLIASKDTYLGYLVEKFDVGVTINIYDDNFNEEILEYVRCFDEEKFLNGANKLKCIIQNEQDIYVKSIYRFMS